jgi:uncharacterized protein (TIGR00730 family)
MTMKRIQPHVVNVNDFPCKKIERVTFFGYADAMPHEQLYKDVFETSRLVAEAGYTVVNGGGPGTMQASSKGAKEAGGYTIGVTFYPKDATTYEGKSTDNPMDEEIVTSNYLERTLKLMEYGQVYMTFQGGTGTISEFGMCWGMARLYYGHHKPLILVGSFWRDIIETFQRTMRIRPEELHVFHVADTPQEAVEILKDIDEDVQELCVRYVPKTEDERPFVL